MGLPESSGSAWTFEAEIAGEVSVDVFLSGLGTARVEYFEYGSEVPTWTRTLTN